MKYISKPRKYYEETISLDKYNSILGNHEGRVEY